MGTVAETKKRLEKVYNWFDFLDEFFYEDIITGEMIPDFELVFKVGNNFTTNPAAETFNSNNRSNNCYIKCSDGVVEYPF
jgi:hypothetical protein